MELCFFFNVDSGAIVFQTTASLSESNDVGPSTGMPNIHSLYCNASINSIAVFIVMNSDPNVEDSTMFCHFEYQMIGALLTKISMPVWEQ